MRGPRLRTRRGCSTRWSVGDGADECRDDAVSRRRSRGRARRPATRLRRTRWPEAETVDDWSQGVPLAYLQDLCRYWADDYDWRATEARLNAWPQFTHRDRRARHPLRSHARSPHRDALPLVLTHGWPGSVVEFLDVLGPLTDPAAHGGDAADAFHVVCPSLPGYGFSDKPARAGLGRRADRRRLGRR